MKASASVIDSTAFEQEAHFDFTELFFSRTDERGKIQAGNGVFQRISQYSWNELLGRPHNIIRHESMPRGVFWLLWHRLRGGLPTGAYVKNRAKDGRFYWVYAIITPIEGGYLSVRLKPDSPLMDVVRSEYASLLKAEIDDSLTPAQSAERLQDRLAALGFADYDTFMATTLVTELVGRDRQLQRGTCRDIRLYEDLMAAAGRLLQAANGITENFRTYRFVPLNLLVQAGSMGDEGAAIGTISANYNMLSEEIQSGLQAFLVAARQVSRSIHLGAFLLATSEIQSEIAAIFEREVPTDGADHRTEMHHLDGQQAHYRTQALDNLASIKAEVESFAARVGEMKRLSAGLAAIRVMGKVEAGRLGTAGLRDLIGDLEAFQRVLQDGLSDILKLNDTLKGDVSQLLSSQPAQSVSQTTPLKQKTVETTAAIET